MFARIASLIALTLLSTAATSPSRSTLPKGPPVRQFTAACQGRDGWSDPAPPVRVFANVYHVGTCGITALLVASDQGHALLDTGPADAASQIAGNITALGFKLGDVKWIVTSHEHHDHVGGIAELKRLTGAQLASSALAQPSLESGKTSWRDPQAGSIEGFVGTPVDKVLKDGEHLVLGPLDLTMHTTPGHAPGSTTWSWQSCEGRDCRAVVYADSTTAVAADSYRFSRQGVYVSAFRRSLAKIAALDCDILITPHPGASALHERLAGRQLLVDAQACRRYAEGAGQRLDARLAEEGAPQ